MKDCIRGLFFPVKFHPAMRGKRRAGRPLVAKAILGTGGATPAACRCQPITRLWRLDLPDGDQKVAAGLCQIKHIFRPTKQWVVRECRIQCFLFINDAAN
ncbi:MAG TPA: hypothetical protein PKD12_19535 [Nitrospira sp.]|nr:hypothetical protein [Nitrospira sp.]